MEVAEAGYGLILLVLLGGGIRQLYGRVRYGKWYDLND